MTKTFYEKLRAVQMGFNAPKNQYNKFGDYYYRSAEDMEAGLKPLLDEQGITMLIDDEVVMIGERFYVKATVIVTDGDKTVYAHGYAREVETKTKSDPAQITGMASSYARKYALGGLFLVDDQPDIDSQEPTRAAKTGANKKPASKSKAALWSALGGKAELANAVLFSGHPDTEEFYAEVLKFYKVLEEYCAIHGADVKAMAEGCKKRPDVPNKDTVTIEQGIEWYSILTEEFSSQL